MAALFVGKKIYPMVEIGRCLKYWFSAKNIADLKNQYFFFFTIFLEVQFGPFGFFFLQSKFTVDPLKMSLKWFSTLLKGRGCCICSRNIFFKGRDCLVSGILTCLTDKVCWSDRPPGMSQIRDFRSWVTSLLTLRNFFLTVKIHSRPFKYVLKIILNPPKGSLGL